jgi:hypothetical protein
MERREEIPMDNPLVRAELARAGESLYKLETVAMSSMAVVLGWFMAAIYYNGLAWPVASGSAAILIVTLWGVKVALKNKMIRRSRDRVGLGDPP